MSDWRHTSLDFIACQISSLRLVYHVEQFAEKARFKTAETPTSLTVLSNTSVAVLSASRRIIEVWDWCTPQAICRITLKANALCMAVLSDGRLVICDVDSNILIGEPEKWLEAKVISNDSVIYAIVANKGGSFTTLDSLGCVNVWRDGKSEEIIARESEGMGEGMLAIVGTRVVIADPARTAVLSFDEQ